MSAQQFGHIGWDVFAVIGIALTLASAIFLGFGGPLAEDEPDKDAHEFWCSVACGALRAGHRKGWDTFAAPPAEAVRR